VTVHEIAPNPELAEFVDAYWWGDGSSTGSMRILPDGRAALALRTPLALLTDARVPLRDVTQRFPAIDPTRLDSVEEALRSMFSDVAADPRVDAAVVAIIRSGGRASIEEVAAQAGVSRQHLARAFAYHVGVSPKTFAPRDALPPRDHTGAGWAGRVGRSGGGAWVLRSVAHDF